MFDHWSLEAGRYFWAQRCTYYWNMLVISFCLDSLVLYNCRYQLIQSISWSLISYPYKENWSPFASITIGYRVLGAQCVSPASRHLEFAHWAGPPSFSSSAWQRGPCTVQAWQSQVQLTLLALWYGQVKARELPNKPFKLSCLSGQRPSLARIHLLLNPWERAEVYPMTSREVGSQGFIESYDSRQQTARELERLPEERTCMASSLNQARISHLWN